MTLLQKILTVIRDRPTYFMQYVRGTLLFYWAQFLALFMLNSKRIFLNNNVRFQNIKNFLANSEQSKIIIGQNTIIYENARLEVYDSGLIQIGESSILGDVRIVCRENITLGDRLLTSWNVLIQDFDPHPIEQSKRATQVLKMCQDFTPKFKKYIQSSNETLPTLDWTPSRKAIFIGNDVWLGANTIILKGSRIGEGSIVAAGAVVTGGDFPPRSLIAGNPAKFIKELPK
ncbi:MAG: acyltransferase [Pseudobdellovibrio sp.]